MFQMFHPSLFRLSSLQTRNYHTYSLYRKPFSLPFPLLSCALFSFFFSFWPSGVNQNGVRHLWSQLSLFFPPVANSLVCCSLPSGWFLVWRRPSYLVSSHAATKAKPQHAWIP